MNRVYILLNPDSDDFTHLEGLQNKKEFNKRERSCQNNPNIHWTGTEPCGTPQSRDTLELKFQL